MAALPYMQLYITDYLADTAHLTTEEHGAYLLLLFNYWQTGKPLPINRLARISRLSNERWTDVEQVLNEYFTVVDGCWVHKRIEKDLDRVKGVQESKSAAGKASAEAKKKAQKTATHSTSVEQPLNTTSTNKDTDTNTDKIIDINSFSKVSGVVQDMLASTTPYNMGIIHSWLNAGAIPELDIYPTIERINSKGKTYPPAYYDKPILQAIADRTKKAQLPEATFKPERPNSGNRKKF